MSFNMPPRKPTANIEEITLSSDSEDETPAFHGSSLLSNYHTVTDAAGPMPSSSRPNFPNAVSVIIRPPQNSSYKTCRVLPPRAPLPAPPSETSSSGESSLSSQIGLAASFEGSSGVGNDHTYGTVEEASCALESPVSESELSETTSTLDSAADISDTEMDQSGQSLSTIDKDLFASLGNNFVNNVGNLVDNRAKLEMEAEEEARRTKEACDNLEKLNKELEQMKEADADMDEANETSEDDELQAELEQLNKQSKNLDANREVSAGALRGLQSQLNNILRDAECLSDDYDSEPEKIDVKAETGEEANQGSPQPGTSQGHQWEDDKKDKELAKQIEEKQKVFKKIFRTQEREDEAAIRKLTVQGKQLRAVEARFQRNYPPGYDEDTTEDCDDEEESAEKMDE